MNKAEYYYKTFIVGLGFTSGLWIAIGINPEIVAYNAIAQAMVIIDSNANLEIFRILPIIGTLGTMASIAIAYSYGGKMGLFGILCAFFSGLLIINYPTISMFLLLTGAILGILAVRD